MEKRKKIALVLASIIAITGLSYLGYRWWQKSRSNSGNAQKDNRKIVIQRTDR